MQKELITSIPMPALLIVEKLPSHSVMLMILRTLSVVAAHLTLTYEKMRNPRLGEHVYGTSQSFNHGLSYTEILISILLTSRLLEAAELDTLARQWKT